MVSHGYKRPIADQCVYVRRFLNDKVVMLILYIDNMLIIAEDRSMINKLKKELLKHIDMKDLGSVQQILDMKIVHDKKAKRLGLSQQNYVE